MTLIRHYLLALQFFTRIPITGRLAEWVGFSPAMMRAAAGHLPGVGLLVGGLAAGVAWGALQALPPVQGLTPLVAAALATLATVWVTGAFHEDGLADTADGLGGSAERSRALEIMKDSRIGSYGAVALVLALLTKVLLLGLLGAVHPGLLPVALLLGHVLSRFWPLLTMATLAHVNAPGHSKSKLIAEQLGWGGLLCGVLWCVIAVVLLSWGVFAMHLIAAPAYYTRSTAPLALVVMVGAALLASAAVWWWMRHLLRRRLQGFTGDGLGATQQLCELAVYLALSLAAGPLGRCV
ncbi:adenosylcobinamide-GDP ribazoletransferase [Curvibacter sp. CHRR-16]|uniref:adenosylcobinamide-GDP ribazoletransferase n=1 Tax=Curvibacter sp. CHRR-16 TaxID=2835872 RepID=UPI001BDA16E2|nr:adenosylcobinamide-GDP ribazoletransferase [Curvibacter sp. CHRR-16]MBT0569229.1 adenosylcobinamide-GDP ribazoletransferase [Curvibacter sp. CHRR-16]